LGTASFAACNITGFYFNQTNRTVYFNGAAAGVNFLTATSFPRRLAA